MDKENRTGVTYVKPSTGSKFGFIKKLAEKVPEKRKKLVFVWLPIAAIIIPPLVYIILYNMNMDCKTPKFPDGTLVQSRLGGGGAMVRQCEATNFGKSEYQRYCVKTSGYTRYETCDIDVFELMLYTQPKGNRY